MRNFQSLSIDEHSIVEILQQRHSKDWQEFKTQIIRLTKKLELSEPRLTNENFDLLEDIADALDAECAELFKRMSGRT